MAGMVTMLNIDGPDPLPVYWNDDAGRILTILDPVNVPIRFEADGNPPAADDLLRVSLVQGNTEHTVYQEKTIDTGVYQWLTTTFDRPDEADPGDRRTFSPTTDDDSDQIIDQYEQGSHDGIAPGPVVWKAEISEARGAASVAGPVTSEATFPLDDFPFKQNTTYELSLSQPEAGVIDPEVTVRTRANHGFDLPFTVAVSRDGSEIERSEVAFTKTGALAGQVNEGTLDIGVIGIETEQGGVFEVCVEPSVPWWPESEL